MRTKKVDTLFHATKRISDLKSIINNGFYFSYADEIFADRKYKVLMISFSNISLNEVKTQVYYGDYFIGLSRDWGKRNEIHPVAYTYGNSVFEKSIWSLLEKSALGNGLKELQKSRKSGVPLFFEGTSFKSIKKISQQDLNENALEALSEMYGDIFSKICDTMLYMKHYMVYDKKNNERFAFNDREWRYVPKGNNLIFEKDASGKHNDHYKEIKKKAKPHNKEAPLTFDLRDLRYIVVKKESQTSQIFSSLFKKFGRENVISNIEKGNLTVLPFDKVWDDLL